jgi:hypothetical protein
MVLAHPYLHCSCVARPALVCCPNRLFHWLRTRFLLRYVGIDVLAA